MYFKILLFYLAIFKAIESYEPLNLPPPSLINDYESSPSSSESFTLCDLSKDSLKNYCQNDGICYTIVDEQKSKKNVKSTNEIFCSCPLEFTGLRCETKLLSNETKVKFADLKANSSTIVKAFNKTDCPSLRICPLVCDFGYEKSVNGCEMCKCSCVDELNFYEELKNAFAYNVKSVNNKFCQKTCKNGYLKDIYGCFKCACVESVASHVRPELSNRFKNFPQIMIPTTKSVKIEDKPSLIDNTANPKISNITDDICSHIKCRENEICKYFDTNMYRCPDEMMDCMPYEHSLKIPVCVSTLFNPPCLENIKIGSCQTYSERYYFDIIDKECKKFYYAGCGGNRNNFLTIQECNEVCVKTGPSLLFAQNVNRLDSLTNKPSFEFIKQNEAETTRKSQIISIPNETIRPYEYNLNAAKSNESSVEINDDSAQCQWICNLNCPFGYKMNQRTKCYKCECIDLNMTECGVPCFLEGTKNCLFSMRANSRPKCVCNPNYDGVYCHEFTQHFNLSVHIDSSIKLNTQLSSEIKNNLSKKLSRLLDIGTNHVRVYEVFNDVKSRINIRFGLYAPDFSNSTYFYGLVENVQSLLNAKNLTLRIRDQMFVLHQNCENTEELFVMDLNENYFFKIDKLKQLIQDLKIEITKSYKFQPDSIDLVKIKIEPTVQIEFLIKNRASDPEFCTKSYFLQNDIRTKSFSLNKYDTKFLELTDATSDSSNKRLNFLWEPARDDLNNLHKSSESAISHLTSPSFMNHSVVFISVIIASFLVLIFLVGLIIITQLKRKQSKEISKISDLTCSRVTINDNYEKHSARLAGEFPGYFLPNYNTVASNGNHRNAIIDTNQVN